MDSMPPGCEPDYGGGGPITNVVRVNEGVCFKSLKSDRLFGDLVRCALAEDVDNLQDGTRDPRPAVDPASYPLPNGNSPTETSWRTKFGTIGCKSWNELYDWGHDFKVRDELIKSGRCTYLGSQTIYATGNAMTKRGPFPKIYPEVRAVEGTYWTTLGILVGATAEFDNALTQCREVASCL